MTKNPNQQTGIPQLAQDWFDRGGIEQLGGVDCFVVDQGSREADSAIVMLHGFPSSSLDWLEDLAHFPMLEDPPAVAAAIGRFLERG